MSRGDAGGVRPLRAGAAECEPPAGGQAGGFFAECAALGDTSVGSVLRFVAGDHTGRQRKIAACGADRDRSDSHGRAVALHAALHAVRASSRGTYDTWLRLSSSWLAAENCQFFTFPFIMFLFEDMVDAGYSESAIKGVHAALRQVLPHADMPPSGMYWRDPRWEDAYEGMKRIARELHPLRSHLPIVRTQFVELLGAAAAEADGATLEFCLLLSYLLYEGVQPPRGRRRQRRRLVRGVAVEDAAQRLRAGEL
eukprot:gene11603-3573_t